VEDLIVRAAERDSSLVKKLRELYWDSTYPMTIKPRVYNKPIERYAHRYLQEVFYFSVARPLLYEVSNNAILTLSVPSQNPKHATFSTAKSFSEPLLLLPVPEKLQLSHPMDSNIVVVHYGTSLISSLLLLCIPESSMAYSIADSMHLVRSTLTFREKL
jgi:hypothetical protein